MSMVMVERALEGSAARKFRAVLPDFGLNGEKAVTTEVMYLVIMMAVGLWRESGGRERECVDVVDVMKWDGMAAEEGGGAKTAPSWTFDEGSHKLE